MTTTDKLAEALREFVGYDDMNVLPPVPVVRRAREALATYEREKAGQTSIRWDRQGPQVSKPEHGREPSLRKILIVYYGSSGISREQAKSYADEYIAAYDKEVEP